MTNLETLGVVALFIVVFLIKLWIMDRAFRGQ